MSGPSPILGSARESPLTLLFTIISPWSTPHHLILISSTNRSSPGLTTKRHCTNGGAALKRILTRSGPWAPRNDSSGYGGSISMSARPRSPKDWNKTRLSYSPPKRSPHEAPGRSEVSGRRRTMICNLIVKTSLPPFTQPYVDLCPKSADDTLHELETGG